MDEDNINSKTLNMSMASLKTTPKSIDMKSSNYHRAAKSGSGIGGGGAGNFMDKLNTSAARTVNDTLSTDMELCAMLFWLLSNLFVTIFNFSYIRLSSIKLLLFHYVIRFYSYFMDSPVNDINNQSTPNQMQSTMGARVKISHSDFVKSQFKQFNYWFLLPLTLTTIAYCWILLLWFINKIVLIKVPTKLFPHKAR